MSSLTKSSLVIKLCVTTTNRNLKESQWNGTTYILDQKKVQVTMLSRQSYAIVFWNSQSTILLDFLEPGATVNSKRNIKTLMKLKAKIARTRSEKKKAFFLQHSNARPHASLKTTECVTKFGWTVLPHLPYNPDLAPLDFCLFGPLKKGLWENILLTTILS